MYESTNSANNKLTREKDPTDNPFHRTAKSTIASTAVRSFPTFLLTLFLTHNRATGHHVFRYRSSRDQRYERFNLSQVYERVGKHFAYRSNLEHLDWNL